MTSEAETMVERIARAMRRGRFERTGRAGVFDEDLPLTQNELADARAVLTALLDPTEEMKQAGADNLFASASDVWSDDAGAVFRAMIQAALQPGSEDKDR